MRLTRILVAIVPLLLASAADAVAQTRPARLKFAINLPASRSSAPLDGRLFVLLSADTSATEPRFQIGGGADTQLGFAIDVTGWKPGETRTIDASAYGYPLRTLGEVPRGSYRVQALINRYETFHRSD